MQPLPLSNRIREYAGFADLKMMHNLLKKKRPIAVIGIWWVVVVFWLILCFYLSWQTGEATGKLSQKLAQFLINLLARVGITPDPQQFHAGLRLFAHFGVFFVTGGFLFSAIAATFPKGKSIIVFSSAAIFCGIIAVLSEVGKLNVPGRHLTWSEAGLNIVGAVCGIASVIVIQALKNYLLMKR